MGMMNTFARILNLNTAAAVTAPDDMDAIIAKGKEAAKSKVAEATYEISCTLGLNVPFPVRMENGVAVGFYNDTVMGSHGQGLVVAGMHLIETAEDSEAFHLGPVGKLPSWGTGRATEPFAVPVDTYAIITDKAMQATVQAMITEALTAKRTMEGAIGGKGLEAKRSFEKEGSAHIETYVYGRVIVDARVRVGMIRGKVTKNGKTTYVDKPICELLVTRVREAEIAHPRRYPLEALETMLITAAADKTNRVLRAVEQGAEDAKVEAEAKAEVPKAADVVNSEADTTGYA